MPPKKSLIEGILLLYLIFLSRPDNREAIDSINGDSTVNRIKIHYAWFVNIYDLQIHLCTCGKKKRY